ncbi:MAG TPA: alanine racemase [Acidobacteriota bacterium]|nr:alanine racemase [Acidobacteriota bacterium]
MRSWVEISSSRLGHNVSVLRSYLAGEGRSPHIIAVVKADGYGHGLELVVPVLYQAGLRHFAVTHLDEAGRLVEALAAEDDVLILVLDGVQEGREEDFRRLGATAAVFDSRPHPKGIPAHLKIDTGMGRMGVRPEQVPAHAARLGDDLAGLYSHLHSPQEDPQATRLQIAEFLRCTDPLVQENKGIMRHLSSSAGLPYPASRLDAVRVGLALYGIDPGGAIRGLLPVLSWKSRILTVKDVPAGSTVGYGATYRCPRDTRLGIIPAGYADGYNRRLSNAAHVELHPDQHPSSPGPLLAPVIGRVSMDLLTIDLTDHPEISPGTVVTLLSNTPSSPCSARSLAVLLHTVPYEVLTSIGTRIKREMGA